MCEIKVVREDERVAWYGGMENAYNQDEIEEKW